MKVGIAAAGACRSDSGEPSGTSRRGAPGEARSPLSRSFVCSTWNTGDVPEPSELSPVFHVEHSPAVHSWILPAPLLGLVAWPQALPGASGRTSPTGSRRVSRDPVAASSGRPQWRCLAPSGGTGAPAPARPRPGRPVAEPGRYGRAATSGVGTRLLSGRPPGSLVTQAWAALGARRPWGCPAATIGARPSAMRLCGSTIAAALVASACQSLEVAWFFERLGRSLLGVARAAEQGRSTSRESGSVAPGGRGAAGEEPKRGEGPVGRTPVRSSLARCRAGAAEVPG